MRASWVLIFCFVAAGCAGGKADLPAAAKTPEVRPAALAGAGLRTVKRTICLAQANIGYHGATDVILNGSSPDENFYYSPTVEIFGEARGSQTLLRFDEIPVPSGAGITKALVVLTMERKPRTTFGTARAYRMLVDCDFERATWNYRDVATKTRWGDNAQATPKAGVDYDPAAVGEADSTGIFAGEALQIEVTSAVQYWVAHPDMNYGLIIKADEDKRVGVFDSCKWPDVSRRPRLYVTYTAEIPSAGAPAPEP